MGDDICVLNRLWIGDQSHLRHHSCSWLSCIP